MARAVVLIAPIAAALVLTAAAARARSGSAAASAWAPERVATVDPDDLQVGTELVAVADVMLHRAALVAGSRVRVVELHKSQGEVASVDVELADGHVVRKVAIATIRTRFRVASPP